MRDLALPLAALGAAAVGIALDGRRRGSRSIDWQLPDVGQPPAGTKPRWVHGWKKGGAWAREQLEASPIDTMEPKARKIVEDNTLGLPDLGRLERTLRMSLAWQVQPHRIADARRLNSVAGRKLSYALTTDQRTFWTGVQAYTMKVMGDWTADPELAGDFLDRVEIGLVRAWRRKRKTEPQGFDLDALIASVAGKNGSQATGAPFRFSGDVCVSTHENIVNWSIDEWWHPTTAEQIEWSEFRDAVDLTPKMVTASGYLGWEPDWMPFEQWVGGDDGWKTEPGGGTHSWFKATLPSGAPVYVWQGSGIEHWWTPDGAPLDQHTELALIEAIEPPLDAIAQQRDVQLSDTVRLLSQA